MGKPKKKNNNKVQNFEELNDNQKRRALRRIDLGNYVPTTAQYLYKGENANILRDSLLNRTDNINTILSVLGSDIIESGVDPEATYANKSKGIGQFENLYVPDDMPAQINQQMTLLFEPTSGKKKFGRNQWGYGGKGTGYKTWKQPYEQFTNAKTQQDANYSITNGFIRPKDRQKRLEELDKETKSLQNAILKRHNERTIVEKVTDSLNDIIGKDIFAYGGDTMKQIPIEVEGGEVAQLPGNQMIEFSGASHEQGGIPVSLPQGSTVFSDRIKIDGVSLSDRKKKRNRKQITLEELTNKYNDVLLKNSLERVRQTNALEEQYDRELQENVNNMMNTIDNYSNQAAYGREIADPIQNWFQPIPGMNDYHTLNNKRTESIENPLTTEQRQLSNIAYGLSEMYNDDRYKSLNRLDTASAFLGNLGGQLLRKSLGDLTGLAVNSLDKKAYGGTLNDNYLFENPYDYDVILNPLILDAMIANGDLPKAAYGMSTSPNLTITEPWKYNKKVENYGGENEYGDDYLAFWDWIDKNRESEFAVKLLKDLNEGKFGDIKKNELTFDDIFNPTKTERDISGNKEPLYKDSLAGPVHQSALKKMEEWKKLINTKKEDVFTPPQQNVEPIKIPLSLRNLNIKLNKGVNYNEPIAPKKPTSVEKTKTPNNLDSVSKALLKGLNKLGRNLPNPIDIYSGIQLRKGIDDIGRITNEQFGNTDVNINPYLQYGLSALDKIEQSKQYADRQRYNQMQDLELARNSSINRNQNSARSVNTLRALNNMTDDYLNRQERNVDNYFNQQMLNLLGQQANVQNNRDQMVMTGEYQRDLADRQDRDNYYTNKAKDQASEFLGEQTFAKFLSDVWRNNVAENLVDGMSMYGFGIDPFGELTKINK